MKKICVIGTVGLPAKYGGWETLVDNITKELSSKLEFIVYCSSFAYEKRDSECNQSKLVYIPLKANGVQSIFYDIVSMIHAVFIADKILILGVSGCIFLPILRILTKCELIVNIDGIEWKRDKWNKLAKRFLRLSEKIAVKYCDVVITDNKNIREYVKHEYGVHTIVIAYGGDHAKKISLSKDVLDVTKQNYPFLLGQYAFSVCRIEPENNIELILRAFEKNSGVPLVLVGNWDNSFYGVKLKKKYSQFSHIFLLDPLYDAETLGLLRSNAFIYLHGHSVGGTNPSLVEAMSLGLPIIAFDVNYNRTTTYNKALYFSKSGELAAIITSMNKNTLYRVGKDMQNLAQQYYTWERISYKYYELLGR